MKIQEGVVTPFSSALSGTLEAVKNNSLKAMFIGLIILSIIVIMYLYMTDNKNERYV